MHDEDHEDIEASLAGDGGAYARLVQRHEADVARRMWRFSRDPTVCEELVQDVFVEAWRGLASFRGRAPFQHWLRRIATRVGYRYWKHRHRDERALALADSDAAPDAERELDAPKAAEMLHALLARLKPADRLVLTLMYFDDCGTKEIAERTGWNRAMVKMRVHRARNRLRRIAEEEKLLERLGWTP